MTITVTISDRQPMADLYSEATTVTVACSQTGHNKTSTVAMLRATSPAARSFRVGMLVSEMMQELVAIGARL